MSLFSRIAALFRPSAPKLMLDGHAAWWSQQELPLNVWIDWGLTARADDLRGIALETVRSIPTKALMLPVDLESTPRSVFFGSRATFTCAIVIQPYVLTPGPGAFKCTTDYRYDKRTGEMRNALVEWNIAPGDYWGNRNRLAHELGHCLGLGHCDGTMMAAQAPSGRPVWSTAQRRYLMELR